MARARLSIPHERRKMQLRSTVMKHKVRIAESKDVINRANTELSAMRPAAKPKDPV